MAAIVDTIGGVGPVNSLVVRRAGFDPRQHRGLSPGHYELWNRIGPGTSVQDLLAGAASNREQSITFLQQLVLLNAVELHDEARAAAASQIGSRMSDAAPAAPILDDSDSCDFEIVDPTDLGSLSEAETSLLAENVQLESYEKQRILAAARLMQRGDYFELLGISRTSNRRELKRAYYVLSKDFHPDRFYGKELGSFGPLLSRIFEAAADTVRTLTAKSVGSTGARRRVSERYAFPLRVMLRCSEWDDFRELVAQDISDRGFFVVTDERARRGDRAELRVMMRQSEGLSLSCRVVSSRSSHSATQSGRRPGLGLELDALDSDTQQRFDQIVEAARRAAPTAGEPNQEPTGQPTVQPAGQPPEQPAARTRLARGTGRHSSPAPIVGIDFGTTYTSISAVQGAQVRLLPWPGGALAVPSVVAFPDRDRAVVGFQARKRLLTDPKHAIASVKRLIGRDFDDRQVDSHLGQAAYQSERAPNGTVVVDMWGESYAIPQLAAYLLRAAVATARDQLGLPVERAVLTVPVGFGQERIAALRAAARLAQLEVADIIDEPSAAALANRKDDSFGGIIGVYDFGGGTFDFSVVDASAGDLQVLGTSGDSWLGGDDLDLAVAEAAANQVWKVHGIDLRQRAVEWQALLFACEQAKRQLSVQGETELLVPDALRTATGGQDLRVRLSRPTCERLWEPLISRSLATVERGLRRAGIGRERLDAVYLSGGTSYVPAVREAITQAYGVPVRVGVPSEYAACLGAGLHGAELAGRLTPTLRPR